MITGGGLTYIILNDLKIEGDSLKDLRILRNKIRFRGEAFEEQGLELHKRLRAISPGDRVKVECISKDRKKYSGYAIAEELDLPKLEVVPKAIKLSIMLKCLFRFRCTLTKAK